MLSIEDDVNDVVEVDVDDQWLCYMSAWAVDNLWEDFSKLKYFLGLSLRNFSNPHGYFLHFFAPVSVDDDFATVNDD